MAAGMDPEDKLCRFCLDDDNTEDLISPCRCSGGQKYVHKKCLIQWQRTALVSQPTHPAFYDRDKRHQMCNVCKAEFSCAPPTRQELMASFTGPEIAALIEPRCVIAAHGAFSEELERQLTRMAPMLRQSTGYNHWIRGAFLITSVEEDEGRELVPVETPEMLAILRRKLGDSLTLSQGGRRFKLASSHALQGVRPQDLQEAFGKLSAPCVLCFVSDGPVNCGHDHVSAVNLTRPLLGPPRARASMVQEAVAAVCARYRGAARVELTHFIGGPCDEGELVTCIVLGGGGCGWTVVPELQGAIELAFTRAVRRLEAQGDISGGQTVRLRALRTAAHLNGEIGIALRFAEGSRRWLVRLRDGEGKQLRPENLEGLEGEGGRVLCFWGDARWTRAQLLGEIAKGDWGLCRANVGDLAASPAERWRGTDGRLAFAPVTEMTESYMRSAQAEMQVARARMQMHNDGGATADEEDHERAMSATSTA